jgi:hypothetical protein
MIVPKTLRFRNSIEIQNKGDIIEVTSKRVDNDVRQACTAARWRLATDEGRIKGRAFVDATVLKVVSIGTAAKQDLPIAPTKAGAKRH